MLEQDAQVLFLGVGLESNTAYHAIEDWLDVPYAMNNAPDDFTIIDAGGVGRMVKIWRHKAGVPRCFAELEDSLVDSGVVKTGHVGKARCLLMEGKSFLAHINEKVSKNPQYLLKSSFHSRTGLSA
jgi:aminoglycoside N3'-acetyltransferase